MLRRAVAVAHLAHIAHSLTEGAYRFPRTYRLVIPGPGRCDATNPEQARHPLRHYVFTGEWAVPPAERAGPPESGHR